MKVFLDSNIWLRLFLRDQEDQYNHSTQLFYAIDTGLFQPYTSSIVFMEVNYVLKSVYKLSTEEALKYLFTMKETRTLTVIEDTDITKALHYYKTHKVKFTDCLIASQLKSSLILVSFDEEMKKIKEITRFKRYSKNFRST